MLHFNICSVLNKKIKDTSKYFIEFNYAVPIVNRLLNERVGEKTGDVTISIAVTSYITEFRR